MRALPPKATALQRLARAWAADADAAAVEPDPADVGTAYGLELSFRAEQDDASGVSSFDDIDADGELDRWRRHGNI